MEKDSTWTLNSLKKGRLPRNVSPAMMADFCWSLQRDTDKDFVERDDALNLFKHVFLNYGFTLNKSFGVYSVFTALFDLLYVLLNL